MSDDKIARKIAQAEFHLERLREADSDLAIESYFAALIACVRSATMYAHEWQIANGRARDSRDWALINGWENALPPEDKDHWRTLVALRNADIHEDPVVPAETWQGGYWGGFFGSFFGNYFGDSAAHTVQRPNSEHRVQIVELAECALRLVNRLLAEYRSL